MAHQSTQPTARFGVISSAYCYFHGYINHTVCINRYTHAPIPL
jgi:hypothetical protein